MSSLDIISRAQ